MTPRETFSLVLGLLLVAFGWWLGGPTADGAGAVHAEGGSESAARGGALAEPSRGDGRSAGGPLVPIGDDIEPLGDLSNTPSAPARSEPLNEYGTTLPRDGLLVRATLADGVTPASGAPLALWVEGGREPLATGFVRSDGRLRFEVEGSVATRYEVGLRAPGAARVAWPPNGVDAGSTELLLSTMAPPVNLRLPEVGTVAVVFSVDAEDGGLLAAGSDVALGADGPDFWPARRGPLGYDLRARFRWVPVRVPLRAELRIDGRVYAGVAPGPTEPGGEVELVLEAPDAVPTGGAISFVLHDDLGRPLAGRKGRFLGLEHTVTRWAVNFTTDGAGRAEVVFPPSGGLGEAEPNRARIQLAVGGGRTLRTALPFPAAEPGAGPKDLGVLELR